MSIVIGLTGGIGSGKSSVSHFYQSKNIPIICADKITHELLDTSQVKTELVKIFDESILNHNKIDRKKLGQIVFSHPEKLTSLNKLMHPLVESEIKEKISFYKKKSQSDFIILDIPLLFETGMNSMCDYTLLIYVPKDIQIERIKSRDLLDDQEIMKRIDSQMSIENKKKLADFIIDNSKSLTETKNQAENFLKSLRDTKIS